MAKRLPRPLLSGESGADSLPDRTGRPQRRRLAGAAVAGLLAPAIIAVVDTAAVCCLVSAGCVLLMQSMPAEHPAVIRPAKAEAGPADPVAPAAAEPPIAVHARAPAPASRPPATAVPRLEQTLAPPAQSAMAEGDAHLADGNAPLARFFYEQAVDAGDAEGALRMGETFDPAFLTAEPSQGDPEAARFWYGRALGLGAAEARARLDHLTTAQAPADRATTEPSSHKLWRQSVRRRYRTRHSPKVAFYQIPEDVLHPKSDGP